MASSKAAWGIEVGAYAIKAVRLERVGNDAKLTDFAVIPHKKVLTTPDLDQDEMIRLGLGQFVSQKIVQGERAVVSIPGSAAFARFAKLPPVEPKKVPDIVKFEAVQQIPFPIEEVEWDYQTVQATDSPEIEVGIFAITKERLAQRLSLYQELGINPDIVTLSPLAVFNALSYDLDLASNRKPLVFLDIGTSATDLVVADEGRCWIRTFPLGGTHFTEAIAESFKLTYGKADALKQESATSKYAKQIMQAMRPVFTDLLADVQKSINYYQQLHRGATLDSMIGLGSTFKIPGLRKFLSQQLNLEVRRLEEFQRIRLDGRDAADFAANTVNLATAYGLALQGVGLAAIDVNLAPVHALREQLWAGKTKWFAAAAGLAVAAGIAMFARGLLDRAALQSSDAAATDQAVQSVLAQGKRFKSELQSAEQQASGGFGGAGLRMLIEDRRIWPCLVDDVSEAVRSGNPQPALLGDDANGIRSIPAVDRRNVVLEDLSGAYRFENGTRRIEVTMAVAFSNRERQEFLNSTVVSWLRETAKQDRPDVPYRIVPDSIKLNAERLVTLEVDETGRAGAPDAGTLAGGPSAGGSVLPGGDQPIVRAGDTVDQGQNTGGGTGPGGGVGFGRRSGGQQIERPGRGGLGSNAGDGAGSAGNRGETGERPADEIFRRSQDQAAEADPARADLNLIAPIPRMPALFAKGDRIHRGVVTFTIELAPAPGATPAVAETEEPPIS